MFRPHKPFPPGVQREALARQEFLCGMCNCVISATGQKGQTNHFHGEGAQAHHIIPHAKQGPLTVENCIILCRSCHLSAHQGGDWQNIEIYEDISEPPTQADIKKIADLYSHYRGCRCTPKCKRLRVPLEF